MFDITKRGDNQIHPGISQVQTCDIWDPHDLTYSFDIRHLNQRLNYLAPRWDPDRVILGDIERLEYIDGRVINYETPEDFLLAITMIKLLRPDHMAAIDGGLSVSWARLTNKNQQGQYAHHDEWREDAERWRPAVEIADYWASPQYRDGRTQEHWIERMRVFATLFREQFPGKPLMVLIWHRERVDGEEIWITKSDFVEMGLAVRNMGCHVACFGRERRLAEYVQAKEYIQELRDRW